MDTFSKLYEYKNKKDLENKELQFLQESFEYLIGLDKLVNIQNIKSNITAENKNVNFTLEYICKRERINCKKTYRKSREKINPISKDGK